jgi:hypothetical protein
MTDKEYKIEDIKKILVKIEELKEKKHIEKIKYIIFKENLNLSTTKKSSGILLFFHNLSQNTYKKLDNFFIKLEKEKLELISASMSATDNLSDRNLSDRNLSDRNLSDRNTDENERHVVKLSNSEKKLIKRKEYYKQINSDNKLDDVYISDDDIFLKS